MIIQAPDLATLKHRPVRTVSWAGWLALIGALFCSGRPLQGASPAPPAAPPKPTTVILVVGAAGEKSFGAQFQAWTERWKNLCAGQNIHLIVIGQNDPAEGTDKDLLKAALESEAKATFAPLWLVLLGHGTYAAQMAKFNLRGPDVSATELRDWLASFQRPVAVINSASASSPFLAALSQIGRVVVTATRSGSEQNFARFGGFFSEALSDAEADLDQDDQVSLLEAFLTASHRVAQFYESEGRLATEHALLDDNGDGLGTPPDWFRGVRAVKKPKDGATSDGLRAHQFHLIPSDRERLMPPALRARRDALELAIAQLREAKPDLSEAAYYSQLETLLIDLARLYEEVAPPAQSP